ncbi:hypothetical protein F5I97DRAFT_2074900 [Phlebopus sp. FC_14]|nr:hypothetical protein F5I97DRAFT_2074900 [Phlebopus sp. FC_14]
MAPHKKVREQAARQVNLAKQALAPEVIAKRTKRHLEELEVRLFNPVHQLSVFYCLIQYPQRTNYTASTLLNDPDSDADSPSNPGKSKFRARQTVISDKRMSTSEGGGRAAKKKSTMNVRTAILYRKGLATFVEESICIMQALPDPPTPSYLTAPSPPSPYPLRMLCTVCGYKGAYKCRRCAMAYCDMNCGKTHDETMCERRVV